LLVHLLDQGGITRKTARIQIAHLIDQRLQLLPGFRIILHCGANLVEEVQTLVDLLLCVGRVRTLLGRRRLTRDAGIAGIPAAAVALGIPIAARASHTVADRPPAVLAAILIPLAAATALALLALLSALTTLAILCLLPLLPAAATLAALTLLTLLTTLALLATLTLLTLLTLLTTLTILHLLRLPA
jgi:hypothetical protein